MEILAAILCIYLLHLLDKKLDQRAAKRFVEKIRNT